MLHYIHALVLYPFLLAQKPVFVQKILIYKCTRAHGHHAMVPKTIQMTNDQACFFSSIFTLICLFLFK